MIITNKSTLTGNIHTLTIDVTMEQIIAWEDGELIQNAMPNLTPDEREFIMTGITAAEWEAM
jgi:hypothetical protein